MDNGEDDGLGLLSMINLAADGRSYLLAIAKELSTDPEKEAFSITVDDEMGVRYNLVIWLEDAPTLSLVVDNDDKDTLQ